MNEKQIEQWSGPTGQRWAAYQTKMDEALRPLGDAAIVAASPQPAEHVLDLGCGCGDSTLELARLVGSEGRVTGIDLSAPMLAVARARTAALSQVTLVEADAARAALPRVDVVYSRFGVMFFDDPPAAFAHVRAAMRTGGRLAFVCWRSPPENEWVKVPLEGITPHLLPAPAPDPHAPGPFAFSSRARIEQILGDAGFSDINVEGLDTLVQWTTSSDLEVGVDLLSRMGPASRKLNDVDDDVRARAVEGIREALRPYQDDRGLALGAATWVVTARA
ncbi:MAG: class I SAM-dependent methyltransferase [Polyangia bacterium]